MKVKARLRDPNNVSHLVTTTLPLSLHLQSNKGHKCIKGSSLLEVIVKTILG